MACLYILGGKTYTKDEAIAYIKDNPEKEFNDLELQDAAKNIVPGSIKAITERSYDRLTKSTNNQLEALRKRLIEFETAKERKGYVPKEETTNRILELRSKINSLENVDQFFEVAKYVDNELSIMDKFLNSDLDISKEEHVRALLEIKKQLSTYDELRTALPEFSDFNDDIKATAKHIDILYKDVTEVVNEAIAESAMTFMSETTKDKNLTKEDFLSMLSTGKDISYLEERFGGLSNSMDKMLALVQKHVEETRQEIYENTNKWKETIGKWAKKLKDSGIEGFDWMLQKTAEGKLNGRFIQAVNSAYWRKWYELRDSLKDDKGNRREYIVKPKEQMTPEDIAHNKKLGEDKRTRSAFLRAEHISDGFVTDGTNHKYSDEFKKQRDLFETLVNTGYNWEWNKNPFIEGSKIEVNGEIKEIDENEYNRLYDVYKRKYFTEPRMVTTLKSKYNKVTKLREYDGTTMNVEMTFVKPDYVDVITDKDGKATEWAEKNYFNLMNDHSETGKTKRDFYNFYVNTANELLQKLPLDSQRSMKGKLFRVKGNFAKDLSEKGAGIWSVVSKGVRKWVNPDVIFSSRKLDENGGIIEDVPIMYVGKLKNKKSIDYTEAKIQELQEKLKLEPKNKDFIKRLKTLRNLKLIEESKLEAHELELDLTKSLERAAEMAENYDLMKKAETTVLVIKDIIKGKEFYKINNAGEKELIKGTSNVEKRLDSYLRMIFYSNSDKNNTKIAKLVQNFTHYNAITRLGLNPFSAINNAIMASINNRIEAFGKQFGFGNKELNEGKLEVNKYIAGVSYLNKFSKENPYDGKSANKFEAMQKLFNWIEKQDIEIDRSSAVSEILFSGISAGEFLAQSSTAIAKLKSIELTNTDGDKMSLWDAYDFKEGKAVLKDGFTFDDKTRRSTTVDIRNMNKIIHGNYSITDKAAIQEQALGQMALQFKKWMFNFAKNRFGKTYFDETTGDYQEGRYRTFVNFINYIKAGAAFDFESIKGVYHSLSEYEKSNLKKLQVESLYWMSSVALYYIFDALAKGIDDDDEELKRMVNFLKKQSDRVGGELDAMINPRTMYNSIKSPIPAMKAAGDFSDVVVETVRLPFLYAIGEEKKAIYTKGMYKGQYKLYKELKDVVPVIAWKAQYDQLMQSGNFYYK